MLQTFDDLVESVEIVRPQIYTDERMPFAYDLHLSAWTKEALLKEIFSLRRISEPLE